MAFPGISFTTIGGKIKAVRSTPSTEPLLIIGTALDGPKNRPVRIENAAQAESVFGPPVYKNGYANPDTGVEDRRYSGATLPLAIAQALSAGATNVWVVRATGLHAKATAVFGGRLSFEAINPGNLYNNVSFTITKTASSVTFEADQPPNKGGGFSVTVENTITIGEFIDMLNSDGRNTTFYVVRDAHPQYLGDSVSTLPSGTAQLSGGTDGTLAPGMDRVNFMTHSTTGYAVELTRTDTGTFEQLRHFRFAVAVLTGIYIDDQVVIGADATTTTIAADFAAWLDIVSGQTRPCFGVIGTRPTGYRSEGALINHIKTSFLNPQAGMVESVTGWLRAGYFLYEGFKRSDPVAGIVDTGFRLGVVAGPDVHFIHPDVGRYTDNWHVLYAALLTTMPPEQAPIYKQVPGISSHGTPIPRKYAEMLVQGVGFNDERGLSGRGAYTVLIRDPKDPFGPLVIFDDPTAAPRDDFFRQYQLVHLVNSIHTDLDAVLSSFLGLPTSFPTLAAMESATQNVLDGYVMSRALRGGRGEGYDFRITMDGVDQALGVITVFLEIWPATALRKIHLVIAIRQ